MDDVGHLSVTSVLYHTIQSLSSDFMGFLENFFKKCKKIFGEFFSCLQFVDN